MESKTNEELNLLVNGGDKPTTKQQQKCPNPQIKNPTFFFPVSYSFIKYRFMLQKKKKKMWPWSVCCKKLKTVLSKWRRFSVYTCRWCTWGTVCKGLSNIFLFMWTGSLVMFKLLNFTIKSIWHSKLPQYI